MLYEIHTNMENYAKQFFVGKLIKERLLFTDRIDTFVIKYEIIIFWRQNSQIIWNSSLDWTFWLQTIYLQDKSYEKSEVNWKK